MVHFTDLSTNEPIFWAWDFENNGIVDSGEQNPTYVYDSAGNYTVKLTVTNAYGSDDEIKTDYITVFPPPIADFTADITSGAPPLEVHFTDLSTNEPTLWAWDFGDVSFSEEQNPTHTYSSDGSYSVTLIASNDAGGDDETKTDYITVGAPPIADFEADKMSGPAPLLVNFTDLSTHVPTSWEWDFDNNGSVDSTDQYTAYEYSSEGPYTVKLTVTNAYGNDTEIKLNYITVLPPPLAADFTADVTSGHAPLTVHFTDLTTKEPTFWEWDFDNNGIVDSTEQNPMYIYGTPGTYSVRLRAGNLDEEDVEIKELYIEVAPAAPPVADFYVEGNIATAPLTVQFVDLSTNIPTSWAWDFDNNGTVDSTEQYPWHTYNAIGVYTVKLSATNAFGSDDEIKIGYIRVHVPSGPTKAEFTADVTSGTAPLTVNFADLSTLDPSVSSFQWDLDGDGQIDSTMTNPTTTYINPGTYDVSLRIENIVGEDVEIKTDYITVLPPPVADFTADVTSGTAALTVHFIDQTTNGPASWAWDFDNNGIVDSTDQNPTHVYNSAGTYTVKLTATTNNGVSDDEIKEDYIHVTTAGSPGWDLNNDHVCNIGDVVKIGLKWGMTGAQGWIPEDLNSDGVINIGDVVVIGLHWGETW
jgi:PKD repeat protein